MMFGSLEFMSLGSGYDMVLLPPRGNVEPRPEPILPQTVRGSRLGHCAEGTWRGRQRSRISDPTAEARIRPDLPRIFLIRKPVPLARQALEEGLAGHQAPLPGPTEDHRDLPSCPGQRGRHGLHPSPARGTKGHQHPVLFLHLWMKEKQQHLPSSLLSSGTLPLPTPLP